MNLAGGLLKDSLPRLASAVRHIGAYHRSPARPDRQFPTTMKSTLPPNNVTVVNDAWSVKPRRLNRLPSSVRAWNPYSSCLAQSTALHRTADYMVFWPLARTLLLSNNKHAQKLKSGVMSGLCSERVPAGVWRRGNGSPPPLPRALSPRYSPRYIRAQLPPDPFRQLMPAITV